MPGPTGLRIAVAGGYFHKGAFPEARIAARPRRGGAARQGARSKSRRPRWRARRPISSPRSKARVCISSACASARSDFDPAVRDRFIAAAMVPGTLAVKAQKFRRWYRDEVLELFTDVDAILAPATPCTAPAIGQQTFVLDGIEMPVRANLGIYTQPISFIGLPVVVRAGAAFAAADRRADHRRAWREDIALRIALRLEKSGRCRPRRGRIVGRDTMEIDLPDVVAEVTAAFERYEKALVTNDVATLDAMFRDDPRTIRYGGDEILYGYREIEAFRAARSPVGLARTLSKTVITTYGRDFAMASTLFERASAAGQDRPPNADLGPLRRRLARRCRAREPHR